MKFLILALLLASCSSNELSTDGSMIMVVKRLPSKRCRNLGKVNYNQIASTYEKGVISLRNDAASMGANTLVLQRHSNHRDERRIVGAAYKCP